MPTRRTVLTACLLVAAIGGVVAFCICSHGTAPSPPARPAAFSPRAIVTVQPPSPPAPPATESSVAPSSAAPSVVDENTLLRLLANARDEHDPGLRREMLVSVCLRWADFDPPAAITLSAALGLDPLAGQLVPNLAHQWAARDFSAVKTWADRLPVGELRDQVYSRLAYERAASDPAAAARLLALISPAGQAREEASLSVLHMWTLRDPAGARAWASTFPAGPLRERADRELASLR